MSERLPGYELLCKGGFGCSSLWLGQDHLLYIEGTGFLFPVQERYRRFRYADIKAVTVKRNSVRSVGAVLLGLIVLATVGCTMALLSAGGERAVISDIALGVLLGTLLLSALLLVRHVFRGEGCVGTLTTGLGRVQPRPLRRMRVASAALPRLEERMRAERGDEASTVDAEEAVKTSALSGWSLLACRMTGGISLALASLLTGMVVLGLTGKGIAVLLSLLALLAVSALLVALAAISRRQGVRIELRLCLWSLLVAFSLILVAGLIQFGVLAATRPDLATEMLAFAQMFGRLQELSTDAVATFFLLLGVCGVVISLLILTLTFGQIVLAARTRKEVSTTGDS
jgi:hypothetical protein